MSKSLMLMWIEQSLALHIATALDGIIPFLFLDSFSMHLMGSVNCAINVLSIKVIMIPPGCTGVTQPVDIGYIKPFKGLVRVQCEEGMGKDSDNLSNPPHCMDVACWIVGAEQQMKQSTMVNAWMRYDLKYFPCTSPVVDVPPVVTVPMGKDITNLISDMKAGSDNDVTGGLVGVV